MIPRRSERAGLWLAVAALHGLLLFTLRDSLLPRGRDAPAAHAMPLALRLIALPQAPPPPALTRPATAQRPPRERSPPTVTFTLPRAEPQPTGQAITLAPIAEPSAPSAASAPASRALDLSPRRALAVPARPTMRDQMLNDPRSNSPSGTIESRVAAVAGSVDMSAERMDDNRLRVRQRGKCIEVHGSRNAQLDPYNQSVSPTPKAIKPSC